MRDNKTFSALANFSAVLLLLALIGAPVYFASNFVNIAGVKNEAKFIIVSQIDRFPNLSLTQNNDNYYISFNKQAQSEAFLGVLILNNPTLTSHKYLISTSQVGAKVFFGEDLDNQQSSVSIPASASIPISLISKGETGDQSVKFNITVKTE